MSKRLNKAQQQYILREMLELARFLTQHKIEPPQIKDAEGKLRDDLVKLIREGITNINVNRESYLETLTGQEKGETS